MKKVLILGARGYVGARLMQRLAHTPGLQPIGAGRRAPAGAPADFRVVDAMDAAALTRALQDVDAVVNCISGSPESIAGSAQALFTAIQAQPKAPRLVHMSSMAVYGAVQGDVLESQPLDTAAQGYAGAKVQAETRLGDLSDLIILRPGCIYGPDSPQWTTRMVQLLRSKRIGDLGAAGDGCSNLVYIDDVLDAVIAALALPAGPCRRYNLAMPAAPRWNTYFEQLARAIRAVPVRRIGARRLKLEGMVLAPMLRILQLVGRRLGRAGNLLFANTPAIPPSLLRLWKQDIRLDVAAASRDLQISWTSLAEGIRKSVVSQ